jgi:hypothetical protein
MAPIGGQVKCTSSKTGLVDELHQVLGSPVCPPSLFVWLLVLMISLQHECDPNVLANEVLLILDVARAQREVCRARHTLAASLADQHDATARLHRIQAQSMEARLGLLEVDTGLILVALRWYGVLEPIPDIGTAKVECDLNGIQI